MSKTYIYNPVTKAHFNKWHGEGSLLLLDAGRAHLTDVLEKLDDTSIDRRAQGKQVGRSCAEGKNNKVIMFSNGVEEFVIVIDDLSTLSYSRDDDKVHLTVYVVND